jgi:DNA-directed RNA polymerase subunit K/omega
MVDFKKTTAPNNTITHDMNILASKVGNIYEAVSILGKRSNQISVEMKEELSRKLQEFASYTDNLEEVFENREQIEISRFYERLPKPVLIAVEEFLNDEIYYRNPAKEDQKSF